MRLTRGPFSCHSYRYFECLFQCGFRLNILDKDVVKDKLKVEVTGPTSKPDCDIQWRDKFQCVECKFTPKEPGNYEVSVTALCGHM